MSFKFLTPCRRSELKKDLWSMSPCTGSSAWNVFAKKVVDFLLCHVGVQTGNVVIEFPIGLVASACASWH